MVRRRVSLSLSEEPAYFSGHGQVDRVGTPLGNNAVPPVVVVVWVLAWVTLLTSLSGTLLSSLEKDVVKRCLEFGRGLVHVPAFSPLGDLHEIALQKPTDASCGPSKILSGRVTTD